jgi:hypothetical protein
MLSRVTTGFNACLNKAKDVANQVHLPATTGGKLALGATLIGFGALIARITDVRAVCKFFMEKTIQRCSTVSMPSWIMVSRASIVKVGSIAVPTAALTAGVVLCVQKWKNKDLDQDKKDTVKDPVPSALEVDCSESTAHQVVVEEPPLLGAFGAGEAMVDEEAKEEERVGLDTDASTMKKLTDSATSDTASGPTALPDLVPREPSAPPALVTNPESDESTEPKHRREESIQGVPAVDPGRRGCCSAKPLDLSKTPKDSKKGKK